MTSPDIDPTLAYSGSYAEARQRFLSAAVAAGATLTAGVHESTGPQGEELAMDLAWIGPRDAPRVLVILSGTHGIEGYQGSAAQLGTLQQRARQLPDGCAMLLAHGVNPYGFAWNRRVNEDNIDVNRNYRDFSLPQQVNEAYEQVHAMILPRDWTDATADVVMRALDAYITEVGPRAAATAISGGQHTHPDGIFFAGRSLCWSNRTINQITQDWLQQARVIAVIDHHTGLGPNGHTELVCRHPPGSQALDLARKWFGPDLTSQALGESDTVNLGGDVRGAFVGLCPKALVVSVAPEVGTLGRMQVRQALLVDNWVHQRGDPRSAMGAAARDAMMAAFCPADAGWRAKALQRAGEIHALALHGMSTLDLRELPR
jgi:Protein of unknown function (DUF2817)